MLPLSHKCATVILFWVRVPVLSEQMTLVEPKVSTPSRFFTRQFFFAILWAVRVSVIVTVISRPCLNRHCQQYQSLRSSHLRHICHDDANDKDDGLNQTIAHDHRDDEEDGANGDGDGGDEVDKLADLNRRQLCRWSEDSYINYSTSLLIGVLPESREATRPAMLPITVSSPV